VNGIMVSFDLLSELNLAGSFSVAALDADHVTELNEAHPERPRKSSPSDRRTGLRAGNPAWSTRQGSAARQQVL